MADTDQPLQGLRVVDTTAVRGELCARLLADLGAEVFFVEPSAGSASRQMAPFTSEASGGHSLHHAYRNANKLGVTIDLDDAEGLERFHELLARSDAWVNSNAPGELEALGLGWDAVHQRHPHLVVCSISDFGQTGPYAGWRATDTTLGAVSGMAFKAGLPEREPLCPPGALVSDSASIMAAFAVLAAHHQKKDSGAGQHLDVSINETVAQITDWSYPNASVNLHQGLPYPNEVRAGAGLYGVFKCRTGFVRLIILSPRSWLAMREWLGEPEYLQDPELEGFVGRMGIQGPVLDPLYAEHFSTMDHTEAAAEAQRRGIVCTPVLSPAEVLTNEHFETRGTFVQAEVAPGVTGPQMTGYVSFDGTRQGFRTMAPELGQHDAALHELLAADDQRRPAPANPNPEPSLPLADLKVMDFGHGGVGVEGSRILAEFGADVVKIESRQYFDFIRTVMGGEMSASFAASSRSKRGLGVNAKTDKGHEVLLKFAEVADIAIENSSTGAIDSMNAGYQDLSSANPALVMVSSQLLGNHGAYSQWKGYGPNTQPVSGLLHLWDYATGDFPAASQAIFPDHLAGRVCALAAMAGIIGRDRHGKGTYVEAAQIETAVGVIGDLLMAEGIEAGAAQPIGNRSPNGAPWGLYRCQGAEEWVAICVDSDEAWAGLQAAMGNPDWAGDERFATAAGRHTHHDEIDQHLAAWTLPLNKMDVTVACQDAGVAAAPMLTASNQLSDPHYIARGWTNEIDQQDLGRITCEGPALSATAMLPTVQFQAPRLGEHSREVAASFGYTDDEIDAMFDEGVLEGPLPTD